MTTAQLLKAAAETLNEGGNPFSSTWLGERDVTFDQCMTLAEQLAIGARMVAKAIEQPRSALGLEYAMTIAAMV
jgi:hypothetical protein